MVLACLSSVSSQIISLTFLLDTCFVFPPQHFSIHFLRLTLRTAAPYLKWLVTGFPPRRSGFEPGSSHVGFVVDKVALW
jgi:hypothetical protein